MMRKSISIFIVFLTSFLIIILSIFFALSQNQIDVTKTTTLSFEKYQKAKELFVKKGCIRCHSVKGEGNIKNPLDEVGKKYNKEILKKLIVGDAVIEKNIPKRVFKQQYKKLSQNEIKSLVEYMKSLN